MEPTPRIASQKRLAAPFDSEFLDKTPTVNAIERSFMVNALASPEVIAQKRHLFLDDRVAVVAIDVIRCATTACAVLAAGARAIRFYGKRDHLIQQMFCDLAALRQRSILCTTIGEFAGRPVPGGVASNSPQLISPALVQHQHMLFLTKNLGDLCCDLISIIQAASGRWCGELLIGCLANFDSVVTVLRAIHPQRVVLCCGGFRKTESLEDQYLGGHLIKTLGIPESRCDDAALAMVAVAEKFPTIARLRAGLASSRVRQVLLHFNMGNDIEASLTGAGIDPALWARMKKIVPRLVWDGDEHWFTPHRV